MRYRDQQSAVSSELDNSNRSGGVDWRSIFIYPNSGPHIAYNLLLMPGKGFAALYILVK